ncbi:MAG: saccharopine dehydrogenase NADP-binding domain-containing protein [Anaerolineales bacterium]|nr:saccharopine dehydrogenase NADP-binding domain-containing protein [Anaerolineales bacterium]
MKVFALGGYGKVGLPAVKLLAQSDLVTEIAIAGRNLKLAEEAIKEIGKKAIAVHTDGTDEQKLTSLLPSYDIIMNTAIDDTVLPAIQAAIQARVHYCDVNVYKIAEALKLDSKAKSANITTIIACGISPCISNIMGVYLARKLDQVEQLRLGRADIYNFQTGEEITPLQWPKEFQESQIDLNNFRSYINWVFSVIQENGFRTVRSCKDGQWGETDPARDELDVPLTNGGTIPFYSYYCGDLLVPSLPEDLSKVPPVEMLFSLFPPQLHDLLRGYSLRILEGNIDYESATDLFYKTVDSDPHHWLTLKSTLPPIPKLWVEAVGLKEDRAARCRCWFTAPMWNVGGYFLTSVSLATAVNMILRDEIQKRGVTIAEKAYKPEPFLEEVASLIPDSLPNQKMLDESFEWLK